jgi:hypothetical protein
MLEKLQRRLRKSSLRSKATPNRKKEKKKTYPSAFFSVPSPMTNNSKQIQCDNQMTFDQSTDQRFNDGEQEKIQKTKKKVSEFSPPVVVTCYLFVVATKTERWYVCLSYRYLAAF